MSTHTLALVSDPKAALQVLQDASRERAVVVFKHSPTCPVSTRALREFKAFLAALEPADELGVAHVDVLDQRGLARGLTAALGIEHQSPQVLWFEGGQLTWHESHGALTQKRFAEQLSGKS